jgi:two-component system sensor histidine kinase KdpD
MALDEVLPLSLVGLEVARVDVNVPEDLPLLIADPGLLERVLANVVGNALKFSPPQCRIGITAQRLGDHVALIVVDHGPGVAGDAGDEMFVPFRQMGDRRQSGGVGLGLAVARGFVEAMSGDIVASATPGGGLTMTVRLPAAVAHPVAR